jgi:zinc/manganese transport system substrate-binding protein
MTPHQRDRRFLALRKRMAGAATTWLVGFGLLPLLLPAASMAAEPVRIGTSEFVYSDLAQQIGGSVVAVTLLDRQTVVARGNSLAGSDLILSGGISADAWLRDALRNASPRPVVFEVMRYNSDKSNAAERPIYDPNAVAGLAQDLAKELSRRAPADAPAIAANLARYAEAFRPIDRKMAEIAKTYEGTQVFLTEASFRGLVRRLHFEVQDEAYLRDSKGGTAPSAKSVAELKDAIGRRKASILIYDRDAATQVTDDLVEIANDSGIPVVGLGEKLPSGLRYQQWMLRQLNAIRGALNEASP